MEIMETFTFTRQIVELLDDGAYSKFKIEIAARPEAGALIRGGGGIRKIRIATGSRGRRGGARVIYYWARRHEQILLLFAYAKNAVADLTPRQAE